MLNDDTHWFNRFQVTIVSVLVHKQLLHLEYLLLQRLIDPLLVLDLFPRLKQLQLIALFQNLNILTSLLLHLSHLLAHLVNLRLQFQDLFRFLLFTLLLQRFQLLLKYLNLG
jgi:hypothetical protein